MNLSIKEWIRRHPIEAFFIMAIAICYATLFPVIYFVPRDTMSGQILGYYLSKIGVYRLYYSDGKTPFKCKFL
jgi:hypothetical protein